jgi:hypothetical protein
MPATVFADCIVDGVATFKGPTLTVDGVLAGGRRDGFCKPFQSIRVVSVDLQAATSDRRERRF